MQHFVFHGMFAYKPAAGTVLCAGAHTLHVDFIPSDTTKYNAASKEVTINVQKATSEITWNNPADILAGTELSSEQLNAVSSVPGTFVYYSICRNCIESRFTYIKAVFAPTEATNYNTASKDVTINVLTPVQKIQQIITMVKSLNLNAGQSNELIVKLNAAVKNLNSGKTNEAINDINSFINEVKGYVSSKVISQAEGQALISEVNSVINAIKK